MFTNGLQPGQKGVFFQAEFIEEEIAKDYSHLRFEFGADSDINGDRYELGEQVDVEYELIEAEYGRKKLSVDVTNNSDKDLKYAFIYFVFLDDGKVTGITHFNDYSKDSDYFLSGDTYNYEITVIDMKPDYDKVYGDYDEIKTFVEAY